VPGKKRKKSKRTADAIAALSPAAQARRRLARGSLVVLAALYLLTVWLDGVGSTVPHKLMPRTWVFFAQVSALFTTASPKIVDYRAEGWVCSERRWVEIDLLPYFPLDAGNKENRFQRALQFYRRNRTVMHALDDFVVHHHNARGSEPSIGGVRFLSLRIPYPPPGAHVEPYAVRPVSAYAKDERKDWYFTPRSRRAERCGEGQSGEDDTHELEKLFGDPNAQPKEEP
jgi:hypothetical protein